MSYDIYLRGAKPCRTCGHIEKGPNLPDPTYNLTPIFDLALTGEDLPNPEVSEGRVVVFRAKTDRPRGLWLLDGRKAADTLEELDGALARLLDPALRPQFIALEPSNKWGSLAGAVEVMTELRDAAKQLPTLTWEIT